jgi:hypothetical protein
MLSTARQTTKQKEYGMIMKFKDAPIGARFNFLGEVWIKLNSYPEGMHHSGRGEIIQWNGNNSTQQSICCWVDEENGYDYDTEIELI